MQHLHCFTGCVGTIKHSICAENNLKILHWAFLHHLHCFAWSPSKYMTKIKIKMLPKNFSWQNFALQINLASVSICCQQCNHHTMKLVKCNCISTSNWMFDSANQEKWKMALHFVSPAVLLGKHALWSLMKIEAFQL